MAHNRSSNSLSADLTKWSNTLKQFVGNLATNCLSVFDHSVGLALKGLIMQVFKYNQSSGDTNSDESLAGKNDTVEITEPDESQSLSINETQQDERSDSVSDSDSKHRTEEELGNNNSHINRNVDPKRTITKNNLVNESSW